MAGTGRGVRRAERDRQTDRQTDRKKQRKNKEKEGREREREQETKRDEFSEQSPTAIIIKPTSGKTPWNRHTRAQITDLSASASLSLSPSPKNTHIHTHSPLPELPVTRSSVAVAVPLWAGGWRAGASAPCSPEKAWWPPARGPRNTGTGGCGRRARRPRRSRTGRRAWLARARGGKRRRGAGLNNRGEE